jgi:hypothetical protein
MRAGREAREAREGGARRARGGARREVRGWGLKLCASRAQFCFLCAVEFDAKDAREVAPCGCAAHLECVQQMPLGESILKQARMVRGFLQCEAHGKVLFREGATVKETVKRSDMVHTETFVTMSLASAVVAAEFTLSHAPELKPGLQSLMDKANVHEVTVADMAREVVGVMDTFRYGVCEKEECKRGFFYVGGCGDREAGKFRRCFMCKDELECSWDEGVFRCANPTCRRVLLREATYSVGAAQCSLTACLCMDLETTTTESGEVVGVEDEHDVHAMMYGTCARCHGLCGDKSYYPLFTRFHWRNHLFQRGARVTLSPEYVYDKDGRLNRWVRVPSALPPRMVELAEESKRFPGYCGCHEMQAFLEGGIAAHASMEEAEAALADVLRCPQPLVDLGARVNWSVEEDDDAFDEGDVVSMDSVLRPSVNALTVRAQWFNDEAVALVDHVWGLYRSRSLSVAAFKSAEESVTQLIQRMRESVNDLRIHGQETLAEEFTSAFHMGVLRPMRRLKFNMALMLLRVSLGGLENFSRDHALMATADTCFDMTVWQREEVFLAEQRAVTRVQEWSGQLCILCAGYTDAVNKMAEHSAIVRGHDASVIAAMGRYMPVVPALYACVSSNRSESCVHWEAWRTQVRGLLSGVVPHSGQPEDPYKSWQLGVVMEMGLLIVWTLHQLEEGVLVARGAIEPSETMVTLFSEERYAHSVADDCAAMTRKLKTAAEAHVRNAPKRLLAECESKYVDVLLLLRERDMEEAIPRQKRLCVRQLDF